MVNVENMLEEHSILLHWIIVKAENSSVGERKAIQIAFQSANLPAVKEAILWYANELHGATLFSDSRTQVRVFNHAFSHHIEQAYADEFNCRLCLQWQCNESHRKTGPMAGVDWMAKDALHNLPLNEERHAFCRAMTPQFFVMADSAMGMEQIRRPRMSSPAQLDRPAWLRQEPGGHWYCWMCDRWADVQHLSSKDHIRYVRTYASKYPNGYYTGWSRPTGIPAAVAAGRTSSGSADVSAVRQRFDREKEPDSENEPDSKKEHIRVEKSSSEWEGPACALPSAQWLKIGDRKFLSNVTGQICEYIPQNDSYDEWF